MVEKDGRMSGKEKFTEKQHGPDAYGVAVDDSLTHLLCPSLVHSAYDPTYTI